MESLCIPPKPCNDRPSFALLFALAFGGGESAVAGKNDKWRMTFPYFDRSRTTGQIISSKLMPPCWKVLR